MSENTELFDVLETLEGVTSLVEHKFKKTDEQNYYGFGLFEFTSDKEETPYTIMYAIFRKPLNYAISFSVNFIYEKLESKLETNSLLELIDKFNRISIGIKAHSLPQEKDDELKVSLNSEFFLPGENETLEETGNKMWVTLRFIENAPLVFSDFLKAQKIKHDYLSEENE